MRSCSSFSSRDDDVFHVNGGHSIFALHSSSSHSSCRRCCSYGSIDSRTSPPPPLRYRGELLWWKPKTLSRPFFALATLFGRKLLVWEEYIEWYFCTKRGITAFLAQLFENYLVSRLTPPEYPYGKRIRRNDAIISTAFRISLYPHCSPVPDPSMQLLLIPTIHAWENTLIFAH